MTSFQGPSGPQKPFDPQENIRFTNLVYIFIIIIASSHSSGAQSHEIDANTCYQKNAHPARCCISLCFTATTRPQRQKGPHIACIMVMCHTEQMERRSMSRIMCGSIHTHPQTFPTRLFFVCMRIGYVLCIGRIRQSYGPSISCFERLCVLRIRTYQKMVRQRRNYRRNISACQCFDAEYHMQAFNHSISASRRFK
jgi:hypothetical protein